MNMPLMNLEVRSKWTSCSPGSGRAQIAALLGFALLDQTRIATATSEIARNSVQYAGGGRVEFQRRDRDDAGIHHPRPGTRTGHQRPSEDS